MKKFLSILLAVMLLLSVSSVAMADGGNDDQSQQPSYALSDPVTIKKQYDLVGEGSSPAETFYLTQVHSTVRDSECAQNDIPDLVKLPNSDNVGSVTFAAGAAGSENNKIGNISVTLPTYSKVGVYTYELKETASPNQGVATFTGSIYLVVTVQNVDGKPVVVGVHTEGKNPNGGFDSSKKSDTFVNTYSAGTLNVTKTVAGNLGDKEKKFAFTVVFTKESGKTVASTIGATVAGAAATDFIPSWAENKYTYTFELAHGETATFTNIPYGVSYVVTENEVMNTAPGGDTPVYKTPDSYVVTMTGASGTVNSASQTAAFTNTKNGDVDTGVSLDSLPYLLMLAVAGAGLVLMIARKRRVQD